MQKKATRKNRAAFSLFRRKVFLKVFLKYSGTSAASADTALRKALMLRQLSHLSTATSESGHRSRPGIPERRSLIATEGWTPASVRHDAEPVPCPVCPGLCMKKTVLPPLQVRGPDALFPPASLSALSYQMMESL